MLGRRHASQATTTGAAGRVTAEFAIRSMLSWQGKPYDPLTKTLLQNCELCVRFLESALLPGDLKGAKCLRSQRSSENY